MLLLKKKEITSNKISYYYQPEFKGDFGVVSFLTDRNKFEVDKLAENDDEYSSPFLRHALEYLMKFAETKDYPDEKKVYWGL